MCIERIVICGAEILAYFSRHCANNKLTKLATVSAADEQTNVTFKKLNKTSKCNK